MSLDLGNLYVLTYALITVLYWYHSRILSGFLHTSAGTYCEQDRCGFTKWQYSVTCGSPM